MGNQNRILTLAVVLILLWSPLFNLHAQWEATNGPAGGEVDGFLVSDSSIFCWGPYIGILRSTDKGSSWGKIDGGPEGHDISAMGANPRFIFFANSTFASPGGIFRSSDGGESWQEVSSGLTNRNIKALAVMDSVLLAGTPAAVFRSTNDGTSWSSITTGLPSSNFRLLFENDTLLFASGEVGGFFRSTDLGMSWAISDTGMTGAFVHDLFFTGQEILAQTGSGVFRSTDLGSHWSGAGLGSIGGAIFKSGSVLLAGTQGGLYRSVNNGTTWTPADSGLARPYVFDMVESDSMIFAGSYGGIHSSSDAGISWQRANSGLSALSVNEFDTLGAYLYAAGSAGGMFRTSDAGGTWETATNGMSSYNFFTVRNFGGILLAGGYKNAFRSVDSGATWVECSGLDSYDVLTFAAKDSVFFAGSDKVYRSTDLGVSWSPAGPAMNNKIIQRLIVKDSILFAGVLSYGVYRSGDLGDTWQEINTGLSSLWVLDLIEHRGMLFTGSLGGGVSVSTDGFTWYAPNIGLTNLIVRSLAASGPYILAGTENGIFRSSDYGVHWESVSENLPTSGFNWPRWIVSLSFAGPWCFAGVIEGGVWRRDISELVSTPLVKNDFPEDFMLFQGYPNPFNPQATIEFRVPTLGRVQLAVYDLLGRAIAVLRDEILPAGRYQTIWDASKVPSGTYYVRLEAGSFVQTRKMVLVR